MSQSFYLGTREVNKRIPDQSTDPYLKQQLRTELGTLEVLFKLQLRYLNMFFEANYSLLKSHTVYKDCDLQLFCLVILSSFFKSKLVKKRIKSQNSKKIKNLKLSNQFGQNLLSEQP